MGASTGLLTSQNTQDVLERYYIDPKILSAIEIGITKIKILGEDSSRSFLTQRIIVIYSILFTSPSRIFILHLTNIKPELIAGYI